MTDEVTPQQRRKFYVVLIAGYLALVVVAVLLYDRLPWLVAGMGGLGAALVVAALGGWWRRRSKSADDQQLR